MKVESQRESVEGKADTFVRKSRPLRFRPKFLIEPRDIRLRTPRAEMAARSSTGTIYATPSIWISIANFKNLNKKVSNTA